MASVAMETAVSNPKVVSVPLISLSMVLGTPTLGTPFSLRNKVTDCVSSPAEGDQGIDFIGLQNFLDLQNAAWNLLHIRARGVKDGATLQLDAVGVLQRKGNPVVVQDATPPVEEADELIAIGVDALLHSRIDYCIQSGAIAATGQQSNSHRKNLLIEFARPLEAEPGACPWNARPDTVNRLSRRLDQFTLSRQSQIVTALTIPGKPGASAFPCWE